MSIIGGGMQHAKKRFTTGGDGDDIKIKHGLSEEESRARQVETNRIEASLEQESRNRFKPKKQIIPYGNRILCKRRKVGGKLGSGVLVAANITEDRLTEIAEVVFVPELTLADKQLVNNAEAIMNALGFKAMEGDALALNALMTFKDYLHIKSIHVGDTIFIGKYVGTNFDVGETGESLCLVDGADIRGLVVEVEQ